MPPTLYFHPLSSFCHKALIALYERAMPFERVVVDLGDPASLARFKAVWPPSKMPVLVDAARGQTVPESSVIVEYIETFSGGAPRLLPEDRDLRWQARLWDRVFDQQVQQPMQKIVADTFRPPEARDAAGVDQARRDLKQAYALLEERVGSPWFLGDTFTLADCAAAPALFYANCVLPFGAEERALAAYLARLEARPSYARVLREAEPYFGLFPLDPKPRIGATA